MRYYLFFLAVVLISACDAQNATPSNTATDSVPKLKKNYFITKYPQEFFFVQCGLQDKSGNMWFGTAGNGIYIYDGTSFLNFTHREGLCHNDILCSMEDKAGKIWFGTRNGLILYTPSTGKPARKNFISFLISANTVDYSTHIKLPYTYVAADNFVWSILQDASGKIWFATNKGIYIHDPKMYDDSGIPLFTRFLDNDSIDNKEDCKLLSTTSMLQDKKGNIWFLSGFTDGEGLCQYDGKSIHCFKPGGLRSFRAAIETKKGELLFLNTFHGVYAYDGNAFEDLTDKLGLSKDTIVSMKEDQAGNLWFGCNSNNMKDGGVWRYDGSSSKLFTTKDGLSHNCVFCIVNDRDGNIWFGTRNTGLCRYDGKTFTDFTD